MAYGTSIRYPLNYASEEYLFNDQKNNGDTMFS